MDDGGFDFVEVTQGADNLHDDGASLFLGHQLILLQVEVQVISFTELEDCAESDERHVHAELIQGRHGIQEMKTDLVFAKSTFQSCKDSQWKRKEVMDVI